MVRVTLFILLLLVLCTGCTTKALPPGSVVIDRVDVHGAEKVDGDDVEEKIATSETKRALWGVLEGTPLLTLLDAMLVEYHTYDRLVLERDLKRVRRYYQARGFYETRVEAGRVMPTKRGHVRVEIVVEEGPPVLIEDVTFDFPDWKRSFNANAVMVTEVTGTGSVPSTPTRSWSPRSPAIGRGPSRTASRSPASTRSATRRSRRSSPRRSPIAASPTPASRGR
jgi:hypothetical protein